MTYRAFFTAALADALAFVREWEADVDEWYATGDGAAPEWITDEYGTHNVGGKGYTYPTCPHGMSRWTDYDNICGYCEEGLTAIQIAQGNARQAYATFVKRRDWAMSAPMADMPADLIVAISKWVVETHPK